MGDLSCLKTLLESVHFEHFSSNCGSNLKCELRRSEISCLKTLLESVHFEHFSSNCGSNLKLWIEQHQCAAIIIPNPSFHLHLGHPNVACRSHRRDHLDVEIHGGIVCRARWMCLVCSSSEYVCSYVSIYLYSQQCWLPTMLASSVCIYIYIMYKCQYPKLANWICSL